MADPFAEFAPKATGADPFAEFAPRRRKPRPAPETAAKRADIAQSDGFFDRVGDLMSRGAASVSGGLSSLGSALQDINRVQLPWISDASHARNLAESATVQARLRSDAAQSRSIAATPMQNEVTWEGLKAKPSVANIGQFIVEGGVQSIPSMAAAAVTLPGMIASQMGTIGQQRAENDGRENLTLADAGAATPAAILSPVLDRFGIGKIFGATGKNAATRIGKATGAELLTEGGQTGLEYTNSTAFTEKGFDLSDALNQIAAGSLVGAGVGGAGRAAIEAPALVTSGAKAAARAIHALPAPTVNVPANDPFAEFAPVAIPEPPAVAPAPVAVDPQPVANPMPAAAGGGELGQVDVPVEPAPPAPTVEAPKLRPDPGELGNGERVVRTPAGGSIRTRFEVVDASSLAQAEGANQNRDRGRDSTTLQVQDIISKFDPELLAEDPSSDRGAPIVGADNAIDSGNGRVLTLNKIYEQYPEQAARYRAMIEKRGYAVPEGVKNPVLIQRRMTDMTADQRRQFVIDSNKDTKLTLSPVERARSDADTITPDLLAKYAGGDLNSTGNKGFVAAFTGNLMAGEMGDMIGSDRRLTPNGLQRIENAVVAAAYGKPKLLERMMESSNDDIRAITGSMADVAPSWAAMRQAAKAGDIDAQYDITNDLADAAARLSDARKAGTRPADILAQVDAFNQMSPVTAELIRAFHNSGMTRAASRKAVTTLLNDYVAAAQSEKAGEGLFGPEPAKPALAILKELLDARDNPNGAGLTLDDRAEIKEKNNGLSEKAAGIERAELDREARQERGRAGNAAEQTAGEPKAEPRTDAGRPADRTDGRSANDAGGRVANADGLSDAANDANGSTSGAARGDGQRVDTAANGGAPRRPRLNNLKAIAAAADDVDDKPDYTEGRASLEDAGDYEPSFSDASFTSRASIYQSAAEEMGIDPDAFTLLPGPRQVALLQQAIRRKFDIVVDVDPTMQTRLAIDQMLDAFQNVQGMAYVLDLPNGAMSFGGKLTLRLQKKGKFLGQFQPGANKITLPQRSNSFAHEWAHALDFHLLAMVEAEGRGLSGAIRKGGAAVDPDANMPVGVREAFVGLLNDMFFDRADAAAKIMQLEAKIASTNSAKVKAASQLAIDKLIAGNSQARDIRSAFYKGAKSFDGEGGDYWTSPTEMMARAFEAYTSYKVEAAGLTTEFIGKGDANYLSNADERFAKTFPKGEERAIIFAAFENLFGQMADAHTLGAGQGAAKPGGSVRRMVDYDRTPKVAKERGIINRELTAIRAEILSVTKAKINRGNDPKGTREHIADANGAAFMSMTGNARMIQARSGSKAAQELIDNLTKQDGRGDRTVKRTFSEDVHLQRNAAMGRLNNILTANRARNLSIADDKTLYDLLTGGINPDGSPGVSARPGQATVDAPPPNLVKTAAAIRALLDNEFYVNKAAGIDLGYTKNGYLNRALDLPKVYVDQDGFVSAAAEVYEIVFDNEFGEPDALLGNDEQLPVFMKLAGFLAKQGYDLKSLAETRVKMKALSALAARAEKAAAKGDGDAASRLEGEIAKAGEELGEIFAELHGAVRPAYAQERAKAWLAKINLTAGEETNASSPDSKYTKTRALPPEADSIMAKFYIANPIESVSNYLAQSARRTAYARRFGHDGKRRVALFQRMAAEGVSPADQRTLEAILDTATGRVRSSLPASFEAALAFVNAAGTMALLPRATISSLAEPFTSGLVTGNALSGFKMVGMMIGSALGSPSGKTRYELARAMGIVSDIGSDTIMEARNGQTFADETRWDRYVSTMFRVTGLTPLTRAQKTAGVGLGHAFLDNLAQQVGKPDNDNAVALLKELGVRDPEAFAAELLARKGLPALEELGTPFGYDYSTAQLRFSTMIVQEPTAMDRPILAQNPVGRVIFGITGFSYGYWRNIMKRNGILLSEMMKRDGLKSLGYAAQLLAAGAVAYLIGTTVSTLREKLLNPKRWADLKQKGELETQMLQLGFTRTFSFGIADRALQAWTGLKYQRSLAGNLVGPGPGFFLDATQKIAPVVPTPSMTYPFVNPPSQSRKTNTGEYTATQAAYQIASPFMAFGLARIPGGPIVDVAKGVGIAYMTSANARDLVAEAAAGKKNNSPDENGKKIKSGPTGYDKFLNDAFGEVKRKTKAE